MVKLNLSRQNFPIYGIIILISVIIGMLYIYKELKKENIDNKQVLYFFLIYITFAFFGGKMYTSLLNKTNFWLSGLSAYGGLVGVVIGSIIFEKILNCNGKVIKYTIISLPLVYGLTKIACFISGCCYGIPYNGVFHVIYKDGLNIGQFPIQALETITFLIIFIISHLNRNKKNISYITLLLVSIFKFLLDFLRYEHINILLSKNQIFSICLIIIIIVILISKMIKEKNT